MFGLDKLLRYHGSEFKLFFGRITAASFSTETYKFRNSRGLESVEKQKNK